MIVIDASVLVPALVDDGRDGDHARERLAGEHLVAPHVIDLEFVSALRRLVSADRMPTRRAAMALSDLLDTPIDRESHTPLLPRAWQLRHNLTAYDATYVALAEFLDLTLLTADARLAHAPGPVCTIELIQFRPDSPH